MLVHNDLTGLEFLSALTIEGYQLAQTVAQWKRDPVLHQNSEESVASVMETRSQNPGPWPHGGQNVSFLFRNRVNQRDLYYN